MANHEAPFGATYPGVKFIESMRYVDTQGISPSSAQLTICPQSEQIPLQGDLVIYQGSVNRTLRDCKVMKSDIQGTPQGGWVVNLSVLDRRWKWAFGQISGHYNLRDDAPGDEQQIIAETEKAPRDLAKLLLDAMGESSYSVEDLPNDARPMVQWEYANPAGELANLCELLGCVVTRDLQDNVRIAKAGEGAELPRLGDVEEIDEAGYDPPEAPDFVIVVSNRNRYQVDLRLDPWGVDVTGEDLPIDELSFAPSDGWGTTIGPQFFNGLQIEGTRSTYLEDLAARYVFKRFRWSFARWDGVGSNDDPQLTIPGYAEFGVVDDWSFLELEDIQVEANEDSFGVMIPRAASVRGQWWNGGLDWINNTFPQIYSGQFSIVDKVKGFVEFEDYLYMIDAATGYKIAPTLILRCAASVRKKETRAWVRHELRGRVNKTAMGTRDKVILHDEIVRNLYPEYDALTYPTDKVTENTSKIEVEMSYYIDAARREYEPQETRTKTYGGLQPIALDGAIQQVSYSLDGGGIVTQASRNTEHSLAVPSIAERRQAERLRGVVAAKKLVDQQKAEK